LRGEDGKEKSRGSGKEGEEKALGEHLLEDAGAGGAKSEAHGEFAAAARGAREQEIGDVGAGDEEHEADGADEHEQSGANVASELIAESDGVGADFGVGVRVLLFELFGDDGEIGVGGGEGDAEFEARDDLKIVVAAVGQFLLGEADRNPDFGFTVGELEAAGHHADDRGFFVVEPNLPADNLRITGKTAKPEAVAENDDRSGAGHVVFGKEVAAESGRDAENGEEVGGDGATAKLFRVALAGESDGGSEGRSGHVGEDLIARAPLGEVAGSGSIAGEANGGSVFPDDDETVGVAIRKRAKENGVGDAEDGGVGGDADGEDRDGEESEGRTFTEHAGAEANVLKQVFEEVGAAGVARGFGEFGDATEIAESGAAGFGGGHAGGDVFSDLAIEVETEFVGKLGVKRWLMEEGEEPVEEALQAAHVVTPYVRRR